MSATLDARQPELVREELDDLVKYLQGLPNELRQNGAFIAYERRAAELSRELVLGEIAQLTRENPLIHELKPGIYIPDYEVLQQHLQQATQQHRRRAEQFLSTTRVLSWTAFITTTGGLLSAFSSTALIIPFAAVSASLLGALSLLRFSERARANQYLADQYDTLRNEIVHSFGPRGEVLGPGEYYPASTKRIEALIEQIKDSAETEAVPSSASKHP